MRRWQIALAMVVLASTAPLGGAVALAAPSPAASSDAGDGPELWLSGPFGRVLGGTRQEPAAAPPGEAELDLFARSAPLTLDGGSADDVAGTLSVRAFAGDAENIDLLLSSGDQSFRGPSEPGSWTIVAELQTEAGQRDERAWRVLVPDRELPEDGLIDIPAPEALLAAAAEVIAGTPGDGCYIYLCVDVGRPPPPAGLPTLTVTAGEPLSLSLGDGSAMVAWEGSLEPLLDGQGGPRKGTGVITDALAASVGLVGLEPPVVGDWALTLKVTFDRERGWMKYRYRVVAE